MNDLSAFLNAHLESVIAAFAVLVSLVALLHSKNSANASQRSADAAEEANRHSRTSATAADLSAQITQKAFENDAKRSKAYAYWLLYRIQNMLAMFGSSAIKRIDDLSPIQEFLHVYGHTLDSQDRENIRIALNGIELLIASGYDPNRFEKIMNRISDAARTLREDWM